LQVNPRIVPDTRLVLTGDEGRENAYRF